MLGKSLNYGGDCSGAAEGMMDIVDEGKRFCHFFFCGLWKGILLTVLKKAKQWTSAALGLPLAPGQYFFYHITLCLGPGFERVTSRFRSSLWDVQEERFVIYPATNSCMTWDKSLELVSLSTK